MPLSFSLDHIGPLTRTVTDCALLTQIISGPDDNDPTSLKHQKQDYLENIESGINGIKIGVPRTHFIDQVDGEVLREMKKSLEVFRSLGADVMEIDFPESFDISNEMANIITAVEGSSAHTKWLKDRPEDYGRQTRKRLLSGSMISASDYLEALKLRKVILKEFLKDVFDKVDLLHAPVVPIPVPTIAESDIQANPGFIEFLLNLGHCTRPFDYLGLPAVSVPAGKTDNGLPTGFQLVAPPLEEAMLFRAARAYEKEKPWHYQNIISD
jgi:aspartyl-tRNA(Asn)/glutamyl-tRNA(Gln) amidotransferase subunit A